MSPARAWLNTWSEHDRAASDYHHPQLAERARDAAVALRSCTPEQKTRAIQAMARGLIQNADRILEANARDVAAATRDRHGQRPRSTG